MAYSVVPGVGNAAGSGATLTVGTGAGTMGIGPRSVVSAGGSGGVPVSAL